MSWRVSFKTHSNQRDYIYVYAGDVSEAHERALKVLKWTRDVDATIIGVELVSGQ